MKRMTIVLTGMFLLASNAYAANQLLYVDDYSDNTLKGLVKKQYRNVTFSCEPADPNCIPGPPTTITHTPPAEPEYWYYFNDDAGDMIKYKAFNNGGQVGTERVGLNSAERKISDILIEGRQQVDNALEQIRNEIESGHDGKFKASSEQELLKDFKNSDKTDCSSNGDESQDSVFDLLKQSTSDLHKHWINSGVKPIYTSTGAKVDKLSASVGFPSGIQATFGIAFLQDKVSYYRMDDGSLAWWRFDQNGDPYLDLGGTKTAPNPLNQGAPSSLASFFQRIGNEQSNEYRFNAQPNQIPFSRCTMEEITEAADLVGPPPSRVYESGYGAGNIGQCRDVTQRSDGFFTFRYFSQHIRWENGRRVFYGEWTTIRVPRYRWRAICH